MTEIIQITCTVDTKENAEKIAASLVEKQLAACIQIQGPIESHFIWDGKKEKSIEYRCDIKTISKHYSKIENLILEIHPYDTPEIIAIDIVTGSKEYLNWIKNSL